VHDFGKVGALHYLLMEYVDGTNLREVERTGRLAPEQALAIVPQMSLGPNRHILTFPVKQSELVNVVAFVTERSTPSPQLPEGAPWVMEVSQQAMLDDFPGWGAASRAILGCIDRPTRWALHELPELPRYTNGRVMITGDAAHAMLPHQGAGAGQALEDAYVLAGLLTDERCDRDSAMAALTAFESVRQARTCRVQATSHEAGEVYEYCGRGTGGDETRLAADLEARFDWIWNHDPHDDVIAARERLGWELAPSRVSA